MKPGQIGVTDNNKRLNCKRPQHSTIQYRSSHAANYETMLIDIEIRGTSLSIARVPLQVWRCMSSWIEQR